MIGYGMVISNNNFNFPELVSISFQLITALYDERLIVGRVSACPNASVLP